MKGDFSRIRFEANKHYTDVLDQQGRIAYDADHNEQRFIDGYRRTVETIDVIGDYGAPMHDAGFAISVVGNHLSIGPGRYYVHGLLCENAKALKYDEQPFLIESVDTIDIDFLLEEMRRENNKGCLRVYLEVWQRMVTALDDSCLGEPALGQADTTVRMQTVWRVVAQKTVALAIQPFESRDEENGAAARERVKTSKNVVKTSEKSSSLSFGTHEAENAIAGREHLSITDRQRVNECSCAAMYRIKPPKHSGKLSAQVAENDGDCGCQPVPAAGYTGLENQLYRFEIQQSGTLDTATLKWSRENGSIVVAILSMSGSKVTVNSLGMDANLGFEEGQWVEISDDTNLFGDIPDQPGSLYQIQHIDRPSLTLTMSTTVAPVDATRNARMRRWDQTGTSATASGIPLSHGWIDIENGIQVSFGKGHYFAGDAWTVPARSATGKIDWPPCGSDGKAFQPPFYTPVYRAPLACIHVNAKEARGDYVAEGRSPFEIDDCRELFPSLSDLGISAASKSMHITHINWKNDEVLTFDALLKHGLVVTLDTTPTGPLSPANFIVTLETPMALQARDEETGSLYGASIFTGEAKKTAGAATKRDAASSAVWAEYLPTPTLIRTPVIIDSTVTRHGKSIAWTLPTEKVGARQLLDIKAIDAALTPWARRGTPVRARVRLPGRVLYAAKDDGTQLYLDGQTFGKTVHSSAEDRKRIDLRFPSGHDERASDFESWFYLYPALAIDNVSFTYDELSVIDANGNAVIEQADPSAAARPIVQRATIELSYAAVAATKMQLSMSGDSSIASVPAEVPVNAGDAKVTVNVTINGAPTNDQQAEFRLTASLPTALGEATSQTASFTVIGQRHGQTEPQKVAAARAPSTSQPAQVNAKPTPATPTTKTKKKAGAAAKRVAQAVKELAKDDLPQATPRKRR